MSPIIYTPHDCETPMEDLPRGSLWQCDACDAVWSATRPRIGEWAKLDEPRRDQKLAEARRQPGTPPSTSTPTTASTRKDTPVNDPINPSYYQGFSNGAELIDITENLPGNRFSAVKYIVRAGDKPGQDELQDLNKAKWYVEREISRVTKQRDAVGHTKLEDVSGEAAKTTEGKSDRESLLGAYTGLSKVLDAKTLFGPPNKAPKVYPAPTSPRLDPVDYQALSKALDAKTLFGPPNKAEKADPAPTGPRFDPVDYQEKALGTALTLDMDYLIPMIFSEVGELVGKVAKAIRDNHSEEELKAGLLAEYGDVCWGTAVALHVQGVKINTYMTSPEPSLRGGRSTIARKTALTDFVNLTADLYDGYSYGADSSRITTRLRRLWWKLSVFAYPVTGSSFSEVLTYNVNKLAARAERGTLAGSGDDR